MTITIPVTWVQSNGKDIERRRRRRLRWMNEWMDGSSLSWSIDTEARATVEWGCWLIWRFADSLVQWFGGSTVAICVGSRTLQPNVSHHTCHIMGQLDLSDVAVAVAVKDREIKQEREREIERKSWLAKHDAMRWAAVSQKSNHSNSNSSSGKRKKPKH